MLLAKGASGARERDKEFGGLSAVVVLAEDRLNSEPDNANTLPLRTCHAIVTARLQAVP